ncbi:hypothetical protein EZI54_04400 [Marinobacter halodurans]|uniref:Uncharacterized protein n=1 Tax=Marinobacter halodurans TaxID=2528979 RepID=A0ABY1ZNW3_9GAMM|nr:hypothetical protein [Marinobacter halodurans]TBW58103.1 hypothetical protein EZI54_04400 [Marinobacter halodurans]
MKNWLAYFAGMFPVIAVLSVFSGNPYLSILLIGLACIVAIPVSYIAIRNLAKGVDLRWSVISLLCSSTAAMFGLLGALVLLGAMTT